MKIGLLTLFFVSSLLAAGGDTLHFTSQVEGLTDGDAFYAETHWHSMKDSVKSIVNGRLGNINIAADANINTSKLDTTKNLSGFVKLRVDSSIVGDSVSVRELRVSDTRDATTDVRITNANAGASTSAIVTTASDAATTAIKARSSTKSGTTSGVNNAGLSVVTSTNSGGFILQNSSNTPTYLSTNDSIRLTITGGGNATFTKTVLADSFHSTKAFGFGGGIGATVGTFSDSIKVGGGDWVGKLVADTGTTAAGGGYSTTKTLPSSLTATNCIVMSIIITNDTTPGDETAYYNNISTTPTLFGCNMYTAGGASYYNIVTPNNAAVNGKRYKVAFWKVNK